VTFSSHFLSEPLLEFANGQKVEHPQDGLYLYGPVKSAGVPQAIQVGVVGTPEGITLAGRWLLSLQGAISVERPEQMHSSPFPGFQAAFGVRLEPNPLVSIALSRNDIVTALGRTNRYEAVRSTVKMFESAILDHLRTDERRPDVWLVVVPEMVFRFGRPTVAGPKDSVRSNMMSERTAAKILRDGALFPDMAEEAQTYLFARNFHHQLKAQLLHKEVVLQVIRETTLDPTIELDRFGNPARSLQERARVAWNFSTTVYFKGARAAVAARGRPPGRLLRRSSVQAGHVARRERRGLLRCADVPELRQRRGISRGFGALVFGGEAGIPSACGRCGEPGPERPRRIRQGP
jgi:hypothetical protein